MIFLNAFVNKRYHCVRAVARYAELRSARMRTQCPDVATLFHATAKRIGCLSRATHVHVI